MVKLNDKLKEFILWISCMLFFAVLGLIVGTLIGGTTCQEPVQVQCPSLSCPDLLCPDSSPILKDNLTREGCDKLLNDILIEGQHIRASARVWSK